VVSVQSSLDGIDTGPAVNWAQLLLTLVQLRVETGPLAFPGASTDPVTLLRPAGLGCVVGGCMSSARSQER
jgi:hypothetical protein